MRAPAVVYRWFSEGGGWAYPPDLVRSLGERVEDRLDETFHAALTAGAGAAATPFTVQESRRTWLGSLQRDTDPLDPRTRPGETFLLRAALLPRAPTEAGRNRLAAALSQLTPSRPGEDPQLTVELQPGDLIPRWGCGWIALLLLLAIAVIV